MSTGAGVDIECQVRNIDTVVICGVSTSGCVRATALDAMQYGFRPMVSLVFPVPDIQLVVSGLTLSGGWRSLRRQDT